MRQHTSYLVMGAATLAALSVAGCGDESSTTQTVVEPITCEANTMQCADAGSALVCAPDGSGWVSYPCAGGCADNTCTTEPCTAGAAECVNDGLAQVCAADGSGWLAAPCRAGETCANGVCSGEDICTGGDVECASDGALRICADDGTGWYYQVCDAGYVCDDDECVVDTDNAYCTPGDGFCSADDTGWICNDSGVGFEEVDCPADTTCIAGMCVGANCVVGQQYCSSDLMIAECADGVEWTETLCPANSLCVEWSDGMTAECLPLTCDPYAMACGNPDDGTVSDTLYYSVCEVTMEGQLGWVQYECAAPTQCDPALLEGSESPCNAQCYPGAQRCNGNNVETCGDGGTWGTPTACTDGNDPYLECVVKPGSHTTDGLPDALCADPACSWFFTNYGWDVEEAGVCDGTQVLACNPATGLLATTPADCSDGACINATMFYLGQLPGMCYAECLPDETRCVSGGASGLYQTCVDGVWSTAATNCTTGLCWDVMNGQLHDHICGECVTGARMCDGDQIVECVSGAWGTPEDCTLGVCTTEGQTAACVAECEPGAVACTGYSALASDGTSYGTDAEVVCGSDGMWGLEDICEGTETCRTTYTGYQTGCIECLDGSDGGNDLGLADSRCATGTSVQTCVADAWATAVACGNNQVCETVGAPPYCASCFTDGVTPCTESNIIAVGVPEGCDYFDYIPYYDYEPIPCGVTPDCCHTSYWEEFCYPPEPGSQAASCVAD